MCLCLCHLSFNVSLSLFMPLSFSLSLPLSLFLPVFLLLSGAKPDWSHESSEESNYLARIEWEIFASKHIYRKQVQKKTRTRTRTKNCEERTGPRKPDPGTGDQGLRTKGHRPKTKDQEPRHNNRETMTSNKPKAKKRARSRTMKENRVTKRMDKGYIYILDGDDLLHIFVRIVLSPSRIA